MLDSVQQRVLGVLIEKELAVPDSYPLTESALLAGCNQKSNRDPEMDVDAHALHEAILALREAGFVTRVDTSARAARFRHNLETALDLDRDARAVLCELLVRGPQAPGALKPRVARMGYHAQPGEIRDLLARLRDRSTPLTREQPRRPRERDQRWEHLLGPREEVPTATADDRLEAPEITAAPTERAPAPDTAERLDALERQVAALHQEVYRLRELLDGITS